MPTGASGRSRSSQRRARIKLVTRNSTTIRATAHQLWTCAWARISGSETVRSHSHNRASPRRSARRGGPTGSYGGFALQKDRGEDPALGESPEREQEAYEQHGAAVIVKEDGRPNTYRGGNQRDEGDSHEVEQHRAGDPDEDHLDAHLQTVTATQS